MSVHRLSVAPMMGWTDRHARYFLRQISRRTQLYTEMVTTGALLHGDIDHHLAYHPHEHPLALQLGGSDPVELADCARLAERYGYDEINLNVGCPSDRVQSGRFGACLMLSAPLVAECVDAMQQAVSIPVSVKCRTGVDRQEDYRFLQDFVGRIAATGCRHFTIHARNAWLQGLSPRENREIPPLKYTFVYRIKEDFPDCHIVINGGIKTLAQAERHLRHVDGVMIGREAYHHPYLLAEVDARFHDAPTAVVSRHAVIENMLPYIRQQLAEGQKLHAITRHMLGLFAGCRGARAWRRHLSEAAQVRDADESVLLEAASLVSEEAFSGPAKR